MNGQATAAILQAAARLVGANALELDMQGCRFEHKGNSFSLNLCEGPVGAYVIGEMMLPAIRPEQDAKQVLLGMYLNASLFRTAHFPIWYAVDPEGDRLCLLFSLNAQEVNAEGLAQILNGMSTVHLK